jgi:hypothetical protein
VTDFAVYSDGNEEKDQKIDTIHHKDTITANQIMSLYLRLGLSQLDFAIRVVYNLPDLDAP